MPLQESFIKIFNLTRLGIFSQIYSYIYYHIFDILGLLVEIFDLVIYQEQIWLQIGFQRFPALKAILIGFWIYQPNY